VQSVAEVFARLGRALQGPPRPSLLTLDNVQHLGTELVAEVATDLDTLALLDALHPTAAIGGTPRAASLALITELEQLDRGRYTGPVGWIDTHGEGEWAIALRCAEIDGSRARLFAGAGVVADSRPVDEMRETWLKLRAMRSVLGAEDPKAVDPKAVT
jgi:menaquinone-specific isochorismate synthase